ncbi:hypothetical protein Goarm_001420 [Gossypium armourianum]|uniref:RING-type domain-containing protein n=1 Tax=Gossypium armourianum TaxID=34283 RepID=A0A7J9KCX4_9ROSI|nr:hypothetical protein [Gossypium armourianum]
MHHDCPICFEFLFESRQNVTVLPCGHTIHTNCLKEMRDHFQYACPLCSKSVCDMSKVWEKFDEEIAATPMPQQYQNKMVRNRLDPLQRLRDKISSSVSCPGSEMPELQVIQY